MGLEREAQRKGGQKEHTVCLEEWGTRSQVAFLPTWWPGYLQGIDLPKDSMRLEDLVSLHLFPSSSKMDNFYQSLFPWIHVNLVLK